MAFHFGIKPWEVELLTFGELADLLAALRAIERENKRAAQAARG